MFARAFAALMLVVLSSCGGGSGSPSVALSNMVPVRVALHMAGQPLAQLDQNMIDKILDLAIPDANAVINLAGFKSAKITISGKGITTQTRSFNATPGQLVTQIFQVPQGNAITFSVQGFNTLVGAVPVPVPVVSGTTTQAITASATPVVVNVTLNGAPAPTAPAIATSANTAGTSQIAPNDPNAGDTHTYAVTTPAASGTATVNNATGLATYTPNAGFAGTDSFVVTVTDQGGLTGTVTIAVTANGLPQMNLLTGTPAGLIPSAAVINPNSGSTAFTLLVNGQFFSNASIVVIDQAGVNVPLTGVTQTFVSAQQLSLSFPAGFFPAGNLQPLNLHVQNGANPANTSNVVVLSRILQDTTPPGIINSLPQNLATNVDVAASIQVFFSELIDQATITNASFNLKQGATPVAGAISFIQTPSNQTIAIFTPNTPLALNTNYVLSLSVAVKDLSGNTMLNPATISFTTVVTPTGDPLALNNLGFELGNLNGYSASGQFQVLSTVAPVLPTEGTNMVQIDTGGTAVAGKSSTLTSGTMTVPAGMNAMIVDLDFLSSEFPGFIGTAFDDVALATLNSVAGTQSFNVTSVNVAPFVASPTVFGGETGFFPWVFNLTGLQGSNISVQFDVSDVGDTQVTSALLIDNLRFVQQAIVVQPQLKKQAVGATLQFVTQVIGISGSVNWAVNGIVGGNTTIGLIDNTGLYTAPTILPVNPRVTISATSTTTPAIAGGSIVNLF